MTSAFHYHRLLGVFDPIPDLSQILSKIAVRRGTHLTPPKADGLTCTDLLYK